MLPLQAGRSAAPANQRSLDSAGQNRTGCIVTQAAHHLSQTWRKLQGVWLLVDTVQAAVAHWPLWQQLRLGHCMSPQESRQSCISPIPSVAPQRCRQEPYTMQPCLAAHVL